MQKRSGTPKGLTYFRKGGAASKKSKGSKICPEGKAIKSVLNGKKKRS